MASFPSGAVKFLFCNMLIVTFLLQVVGKKTSIFRRLQLKNDKLCLGCSSVLREATKPSPCSCGPECISYLSGAQRDKLEGFQLLLAELRKHKEQQKKSAHSFPGDLARTDDHEHDEAMRVDDCRLLMPQPSVVVETSC